MSNGESTVRRASYQFHVQRPFKDFWSRYGAAKRKVLFVFGVGFDPRCVPALKAVADTFVNDCYVSTVCARFTNLKDKDLKLNTQFTRECLTQTREITDRLSSHIYHRHYEIEVNLFSNDDAVVGGNLLIAEFDEAVGGRFAEFTDVIVDISAFPRLLMYSLLAHLWRRRLPRQNLFAVLTDVNITGAPRDTDYVEPVFIFGPKGSLRPEPYRLWIPVLGEKKEAIEKIYEFLRPTEVFPILPFPSTDPRRGDEIMLKNREFFDRSKVPFSNVMYASGHVPFDVFRKIREIVESYAGVVQSEAIIVSALSGRRLSLGVLLAALHCDLRVCHIQSTSYRMDSETRRSLQNACDTANSTIYWLDGELYEG
jgi:hypothetical protein